MRQRWQGVLAFTLIVLSCVTAKPTTQDTLVVSRVEDETTTVSSSEVTSEEPNAPIKLTEMDVQSKISLRYAHTAVVTRVRNPAKRAQETTFRMLLPDTAFISGFVMTIDGKSYKAYVKPKEEAKQIYNEAVSQGLGAAHIAAKARDSNHFTVSVNVEPNSLVVFNLTYEELLVRRNGVYNHAINLHPGTVVPKMKVTVYIKESEKITALRVPEIRTGNEVDATEDDPQNPNVDIARTHDDREATVTFTPDIEEQKRLIKVYAEKSKDSLGHQHRYYPEDNEEKQTKEGILGQFVVQYDVDRSKAGEILVNDGYFVHFFAPSSLPPLAKHAVFVLDTSGSMIGRKVEQLRDAMQTILGKLNSADYFSIVEFNSYVKVHDLSEADKPEPNKRHFEYYSMSREESTTLVPPSPATPENIAKAKIIISRLDAGGGTNIASALDVAVDLIRHGAALDSDKKLEKPTESTFEATTTEVSKATNDAVEESKKLEPIIIFLTDGDPTVGETDPTRIINRLSEKNFGAYKASIFSLAFGEDADRKFLRKLSLRNEGFMRHIYAAADAALQLRDFYRSVSSPLLADVRFLYPKAQIKEGSLTKNTFRTYYAGSETVVAGRIDDGVTDIEPQVQAFCGLDDGKGRKRYELTPKVPVVRTGIDYYPLERLWAYLTIKQLLDEKDALLDSASDNTESKKKLEDKALEIALRYEFVTPLTSLVVVKPNATKAVDAESVDDNPPSPQAPKVQYSPISATRSRPSPNVRFFTKSATTSLNTAYRTDTPVRSAYIGGSFGGYSRGPFVMNSFSAGPTYQLQSQSYGHLPLNLSPLLAPQYQSVSNFAYSGAIAGVPPIDIRPESLDATADVDYEDTESDRLVGGHDPAFGSGGALFVPSPVSTTPVATTTTITTTSDPLEAYSLKEFSWTSPLLDPASDALVLNINGSLINLKLTKDSPLSLQFNETECSEATDGGEGRCVYLTSCAAAKTISVADYENTYCVVDNGYAGVCCPKSKKDEQNP